MLSVNVSRKGRSRSLESNVNYQANGGRKRRPTEGGWRMLEYGTTSKQYESSDGRLDAVCDADERVEGFMILRVRYVQNVTQELNVLEPQHKLFTHRSGDIGVGLLDPFIIHNLSRVVRIDCCND